MKVPNIKMCVVSQGAPTLIIRSIRDTGNRGRASSEEQPRTDVLY